MYIFKRIVNENPIELSMFKAKDYVKRIEKGELIAVEKGQWTAEHTAAIQRKYFGYVDKRYL
ncbi:MAG: hypothetical protein Q4A54_11355 [Parabacteroides sp.]|nr:hypothetical protein [Parabacteroides sp.]